MSAITADAAKVGQESAEPDHRHNSRSELDAVSFFVADAQTGFGPFISQYLSSREWSNGDIGAVLSVGTVAALVSQLPGGAMVDRLHDKRVGAAVSWGVIALAAVLFAIAPSRGVITIAEVLHAAATSMLTPAIAALSLAIVGRRALGERLGRNARFAAIGNAAAAGLLGLAGWLLGLRAVFWLTAAFVIPGALLLLRLPHPRHGPGDPDPPETKPHKADWRAWIGDIVGVARHKGVLAFSLCISLFHLGNAALMPLASTVLNRTAGERASLFVSACVIGPQIVVALLSPWIGRTEARRGVRWILLGGFAAVPLRAVLLAGAVNLGDGVVPYAITAAQVFDGVSGAVFGVSLPIMAADLMRGGNCFNLCLGFFGIMITIGATIGTTLAGQAADHFGYTIAFLILGVFGAAAVASVYFAVGERAGQSGSTSRAKDRKSGAVPPR